MVLPRSMNNSGPPTISVSGSERIKSAVYKFNLERVTFDGNYKCQKEEKFVENVINCIDIIYSVNVVVPYTCVV